VCVCVCVCARARARVSCCWFGARAGCLVDGCFTWRCSILIEGSDPKKMLKFSPGFADLMVVDVMKEPSRKMFPLSDSRKGKADLFVTRAWRYALGSIAGVMKYSNNGSSSMTVIVTWWWWWWWRWRWRWRRRWW
jgi:hypothetical protein